MFDVIYSTVKVFFILTELKKPKLSWDMLITDESSSIGTPLSFKLLFNKELHRRYKFHHFLLK